MRMMCGYIVVLLVLCADHLAAQQVLYSSYLNDRSTDRFEITGKSGDYYWVQKNKKKNQVELPAMPWRCDKQPTFEIYDSRLNEIATVEAAEITDSTIKEYYIPGEQYFDQLILLGGQNKTYLTVDRYTPDGQIIALNQIIDTLNFTARGDCFILLRSEDKEKILLLCFRTIADEPLQLHGILFNKNWQVLSVNKYTHPYITQPFVQYDFFNYPVEHFTTSSIKLCNNGEWIMVAPSGRNHNFSFFHFDGRDSAIAYNDIKLPKSSSVEDVALSVNNETRQAMAGILSKFRYSAFKNVQVANYSIEEKKMDFDSSFRFNTLTSGKVKNENLYEESFVAVPGAGFMFLKEYGKDYPKNTSKDEDAYDIASAKEILFTNNIANNETEVLVNEDDYTKYNTLAGPKGNYQRGDLSVFYFPATRADSCWSGIINKEQTTELNSAYLSYAVVPASGRLFFLYNSFLWRGNQFGSTTVLDHNGEEIREEGIVFSKTKNTLQFQKARLLSDHEMAVPYSNYGRNGFAIIRF